LWKGGTHEGGELQGKKEEQTIRRCVLITGESRERGKGIVKKANVRGKDQGKGQIGRQSLGNGRNLPKRVSFVQTNMIEGKGIRIR